MAKIQRLEIKGYRGIRRPVPLIFNGKSILLFGENGTGKSSFVDALERILTGRVSTLDDRGQGISSEKHGPHILDQQPDITLTFDGTPPPTVDFDTDLNTLSPAIVEYFKAASQPLYILRRAQIVNFIESKPKQKYELLKPFLPLSTIEEAEATISGAAGRMGEVLGRASAARSALAQEIARLAGLPPRSSDYSAKEISTHLSATLTNMGLSAIADLDAVDAAIAQLDTALEPFGDTRRHGELSTAADAVDDLAEYCVRLDLSEFVGAVERQRERESKESAAFFEKVLEEGALWIESANRDSCPLCEQPIRAQEVLTRIRERLGTVRELLEFRRATKDAHQQIRTIIERAIETGRKASMLVLKLPEHEFPETRSITATVGADLEALRKSVNQDLSDLNLSDIRQLHQLFGQDGTHSASLRSHRAVLQRARDAIPTSKEATGYLDLRNRLDALRKRWPKYTDTQARESKDRRRAEIAATILKELETARKEEVQHLFDDLSSDIDRIFGRLRRDPGLGNIRLEVRDAVKGSVNMLADFHSKSGVDLRAYYSESNLDIAGLSVFLALRRWYKARHPEFGLMILDDVLSSVDAKYASAVAELLLRDFGDYQILLTTHDRIWYEHLRDIQSRCRVSANFINKVIHRWTLEDGPDIREPEDEREALEKLIPDGKREDIAVLAGRLLEHVLQEMRYSLRISVQAKRGELYEIGDLWPPFFKKMKDDYKSLFEKGTTTMNALDVNWPLRNWLGAHFNLWAKNVAQESAADFGSAVVQLFDLLFCRECRRFIAPSATPLGQTACRCGAIIYPAVGKPPIPATDPVDLVKSTDGVFRGSRLTTELHRSWKGAERESKN